MTLVLRPYARSLVIVSALALLLGPACHQATPVAAPVDASPPSVEPGISLEAHIWRPRLLGVDRPMDVVIPASEGVVRNDGWQQCAAPGCVLACVQPSERIEVKVDAPRELQVRALPLPEPHELREGATLRFPLVAVGADDPRGPIGDVVLTLDEPGLVMLEWRTVHEEGARAKHGAPHLVDVELFDPSGSQSATIQRTYQDEAEHRAHGYHLDAGISRIRISPDHDLRPIYCELFPEETGVPPWCELPDCGCAYEVELTWVSTEPLDEPLAPSPEAARPADVLLEEGGNEVALRPAPDPARTTFAVTPGNDVVVRWEPKPAQLAYAWAVGEDEWSRGACEEHACRFHRVRFETVDVILGNREEPERVDLELHVLPPPSSELALQPGMVADAWLDPIAPGDPRGPILDIDLEIPEPGRYRVGVGYIAGDPTPYIEVLGRQPTLHDTGLQSLGREPYQLAVYDVDAAGVHPIRVYTCPDCADQRVQIELQREVPELLHEPRQVLR